MQGIQFADVPFSIATFRSLDVHQAGFLRYALNGSFFTKDKLIHAGVVEDTVCPWCQSQDSVLHRHWECEATADFRKEIPAELRSKILNMPACVYNHGWIPEPSGYRTLQQYFVDIPDTSRLFLCNTPDFQVANLFTDGGALCPDDPKFRVASWGLVIANLPDDTFSTLCQGRVPGLLQTVLRAEIWAAIAAMEWVLAMAIPSIIWVDNLQVCRNMEAFRTGEVDPHHFTNDHDLWLRLASLCIRASTSQLLIRTAKGTSHIDFQQYSAPVERWAIRGNAAADQAACEARSLFAADFWTLWHQLRSEYDALTTVRDTVHRLFIDVGQKAQIASKAEPASHDMPISSAPRGVEEFPCFFHPIPEWHDRDPTVELGNCGRCIYDWLVALTSEPGAEPTWVSTYQLVVHFQKSTNSIGPICIKKQWMPG